MTGSDKNEKDQRSGRQKIVLKMFQMIKLHMKHNTEKVTVITPCFRTLKHNYFGEKGGSENKGFPKNMFSDAKNKYFGEKGGVRKQRVSANMG